MSEYWLFSKVVMHLTMISFCYLVCFGKVCSEGYLLKWLVICSRDVQVLFSAYACCLQDPLVSKISRKSIDLLKQHFKEDMTKDDWRLVVKLKSTFRID